MSKSNSFSSLPRGLSPARRTTWNGVYDLGIEVPQVLFRLSRWENLRTCQGKFDQDAKDRVVRLVAHGEAMGASPLDVKDVLLNGCLRTLWQRRQAASRKPSASRHQRVVESRLSFFVSEPGPQR
ncbi:transposase-like protein [Corynebacterium diphtheriae 31A]|nr:transposase-like protein [Corynebacterium diphtheriae 31A]